MLDGFHRARTTARATLPTTLIQELRAVTSSLTLHIRLEPQDVLWLDNTRMLHGRERFEGERYIVVRKIYHASQLSEK